MLSVKKSHVMRLVRYVWAQNWKTKVSKINKVARPTAQEVWRVSVNVSHADAAIL